MPRVSLATVPVEVCPPARIVSSFQDLRLRCQPGFSGFQASVARAQESGRKCPLPGGPASPPVGGKVGPQSPPDPRVTPVNLKVETSLQMELTSG